MVNIIIRKIKNQWRSILYYLAGLIGYSWMMIGVFPSMQKVDFQSYFNQMPKEFLKFFGDINAQAYGTIEGFLSLEYLSFFFIIIIAFYVAASAGSTIAGSIEKRTIDFDLSQPISRTKLLISESLVSLANTIILTFGTSYSIWILCKIYHISISGKGIFAFALTATFFMWAIYGIAILVSSLLRTKMTVAAITLAFVLGFYVFFSLTNIIDKLKNYDVLSIFYLYTNPQDLLKNGNINWTHVLILAAIFAIGLISSLVIFNKRDI